MKDYRMSELVQICSRHTCIGCPLMDPEDIGRCLLYRNIPLRWPTLLADDQEAKSESDQTIKADAGKLPLTLVPREIIRAIAEIRRFGVTKYKDPDNWKRVSKERYRDAAFRHFIAYLDDPDGMDEESGLPHLWHCVTNFAFLCELEKEAIDKNRE